MSTKLGQNFLTDESVAKKIVDFANLSKTDNVLEIGPGRGILTEYLAEKAGKILAVEIDKNLINELSKEFNNYLFCHPRESGDPENNEHLKAAGSRVKPGMTARPIIIEGDILKINLPRLIEENKFQSYKVVANLPYYITSKIIRLFLETKYPPAEMILMVQKEVGERIVALDGKESILSISVKFYAEPEILFSAPRENFEPVPEVDSAVIRIRRKEKIPDVDVKKFFSLVRAGFSAKRKMLVNNLLNLGHPRAELLEILKKADLEPTIRAEKLSVEDWVKLLNLSS